MTTAGAALSARMVFSSKLYIALAIVIAATFWIMFNVFDALLFFSPFVDFYYPIPQDAIPGFILSNITAALVGIVVSMNVYLFRNSGTGANKYSFISGSTVGTASSMCVGCSSVGFYLAATFGTSGVVASTFLSNFQLPLRLLGIGLLLLAYYSAHRMITKSCVPNYDNN